MIIKRFFSCMFRIELDPDPNKMLGSANLLSTFSKILRLSSAVKTPFLRIQPFTTMGSGSTTMGSVSSPLPQWDPDPALYHNRIRIQHFTAMGSGFSSLPRLDSFPALYHIGIRIQPFTTMGSVSSPLLQWDPDPAHYRNWIRIQPFTTVGSGSVTAVTFSIKGIETNPDLDPFTWVGTVVSWPTWINEHRLSYAPLLLVKSVCVGYRHHLKKLVFRRIAKL